TGDGVCRLNPSGHQRFERVPLADDPAGKYVANTLLEDHAGTVWVGGEREAFRLSEEGGRWVARRSDLHIPKHPGLQEITGLVEDAHGALWVGAVNGLYRRWPDGRSERYTVEQGLPNDRISVMLRQSNGRLWVGTWGGLVELVADPPPNGRIVERTYHAADFGSGGIDLIEALLETPDGRIWIGRPQNLVESYPDPRTGLRRFRAHEIGYARSSIEPAALAQDPAGNLWIGTNAAGATRVLRSGFSTFDEADGLASLHVVAVSESRRGKLGFATRGERGRLLLHHFDGERFTSVAPNVPREDPSGWGWYQLTFEDSAGQWWVPTGRAIYRFPRVGRLQDLAHVRPEAIWTRPDSRADMEPFRLYEDSRGDIWIGVISLLPGGTRIDRWERRTEKFHRYIVGRDFQQFWAKGFAEDRTGTIWAGGDRVLCRFRRDRWDCLESDGLPKGETWALHADRAGRLWVATTQGLVRIDDPAAERPELVIYTTRQGLSSDSCWSLTEDSWGRIYVGTRRGLDRLDPATGQIAHFTAQDGLPMIAGTATLDRQGVLWFGTGLGVARLIPEPEAPLLPPAVRIQALSVAGVSQAVSEFGETRILQPGLGTAQNNLRIGFAGFDYRGVLRYQHRLEGADPDWSPPSRDRTVSLASLAPGTYRFLVRAVDEHGQVSASPASVAFSILPPLWRRWWFVLLAAAALAQALYLLHRARVGRAVELERLRLRIASDLHDDIGASLSQIAILSEVARQRSVQGQNGIAEPLSQIAQSSRDLVDSMRDIVWAINPRRDRLHDLVQRVRRFAADTLTAKGIELVFHSPDERELPLDPDVRRQAYFILKEAVNNIARHSGCTRAEIDIAVEGGRLHLCVRDDGVGFEKPAAENGHGLASLRDRARSLGGELAVASRPGDGTRIEVHLPLRS
ncbi:MAG: hypothetical protein HYR60_31630, partial [Acidobacteria bacterium]|nr:hypothetical protein [Acidobacteriota bacterium]